VWAGVALGTDALIAGVDHRFWGYHPHYGKLGPVFAGWFFAALGLVLLAFGRSGRSGPSRLHRQRTRAFLVALLVLGTGCVDFGARFGLPVYPIGYVSLLGFVLLCLRAVRRYRLVDLTPAFAANQIVSTMRDPLLVCDAE